MATSVSASYQGVAAPHQGHSRNWLFFSFYTLGLFLLLGLAFIANDYYRLKAVQPKVNKGDKVFATDVGYYDFPRMNLTLPSSSSGKSGRIVLDLTFQVEEKNTARIGDYQPRISERLIRYTRKQDPEELRVPYNQKLFREGLLTEARNAQIPVPIMDIVIRRLLIM